MDIQQELDDAIGSGPALPPPADRLVAGRAALRRRRWAVGAGAVAVVATLVVPAMAVSGDGPQRGIEPGPATTPTTSEPATEPLQRQPREPHFPEPRKTLAYVDFDTRELVIQPGVEVLQRMDDLFPAKDTTSVALDVRRGREHEWIVLEWSERGGALAVDTPATSPHDSFEEFVAGEVRTGGVQSGPPVGPEGLP